MTIMITATVQAQTTKGLDREQKAVHKAVMRMTNAYHDRDINAVMASYEPSMFVVFEPENPISDLDKLRKKFEESFAINPKFTYSGHEVFVHGDLAYHFAPWTMKGTAPDGTEITGNGLSVAVLRKQSNGEWLIIFDNPHGQYLIGK